MFKSNIEIRNEVLNELKEHKISVASKAYGSKELVILEDDERVVWAHFKEGTLELKNEIPFDYLEGLGDHCWAGRRLGNENKMVMMYKYIEGNGDFVLYEITI